jgi:hypothetical protein
MYLLAGNKSHPRACMLKLLSMRITVHACMPDIGKKNEEFL